MNLVISAFGKIPQAMGVARGLRFGRGALLLAALLVLPACTSRVPATVTVGPLMPISQEPRIFLTASSRYERVQRAMVDAGLSLTASVQEANYVLDVRIGSSRGSNECGSTNNVVYILNGGNQRILVIKGRGRTGNCPSNILDEMSRKLATFFFYSD